MHGHTEAVYIVINAGREQMTIVTSDVVMFDHIVSYGHDLYC